MRPELRRTTLAVLLLLAPVAARAQVPGAASDLGDVPLEALLDPSVEAAALHEEQAAEAAASVVVIPGEVVRAHGARTLAEALRGVPGLFGYRDDLFTMVGVRGVGPLLDWTTRLLVLVDGHPLNNGLALGQSYLDRDLPVPLVAVERIEVVKGPVGAVYGPTAFLGVINVVTRREGRGGELQAGVEAAQGRLVGGEGSALLLGQVGEASLAGAVSASGGRDLTWTFPELAADPSRPAPPGGVVAGADGAGALAGHLRLAWRALTVTAACADAFHRLPTAPYEGLVGDPASWVRVRSCYLDASAQWAPAPRLALLVRAAYDDYAFQDSYPYAGPPDGVGAYKDRGDDRWGTAEVRASWRPRGGTLLVAGGSLQHHATRQQAYAPADPSVGSPDLRQAFTAAHLYLLAEQDLPGHLRLHAGVTAAHNSIFGGRFSPKLAAVWTPRPADVLKVVASTGFRPPSVSEAYYQDGTDYLPNPALRPETVRSLELAWTHRQGQHVSITATLFGSSYGDLIQYVTVAAPGLPGPPDPAVPSDWRQQAQNADHLDTVGAELSGEVSLGRRLRASAGLSWQRAGAATVNFPALTAGGTLEVRTPWDPLQLVARGSLVSSRPKDPGNPGARPRVPAAGLLDLGLNLEVPGADGLTLHVRAANLLSSAAPDPLPGDFAPVSELPAAPRTFVLSLRWRWD